MYKKEKRTGFSFAIHVEENEVLQQFRLNLSNCDKQYEKKKTGVEAYGRAELHDIFTRAVAITALSAKQLGFEYSEVNSTNSTDIYFQLKKFNEAI